MATKKKTGSTASKIKAVQMREVTNAKLADVTKKVIAFYKANKSTMFASAEHKAVFFNTAAKVMTKGIKFLLRQNVNTFSNKVYIEAVMAPAKAKLKAKHQMSKVKAEAFFQKKGLSYNYGLTKINSRIADIEKDAKLKRAFAAAVKAGKFPEQLTKYEIVMLNKKVRQSFSIDIDLIPTINKARKPYIAEKKVNDIYRSVIVPLLGLFNEEKVFSFANLSKLQEMLKDTVMNGAYKLDSEKNQINKLKPQLTLTYGPKEEVLGRADVFGYKGIIGTTYTEQVGAKKMTFTSGEEYLEAYVASNQYVMAASKAKLKGVKGVDIKKPAKLLFYPRLKQFVLDSNIQVNEEIGKFVESMLETYRKNNVSESTIKDLGSIEIQGVTLSLSVRGDDIYINYKRNNKAKKPTSKKATPKTKVTKATPKKVEKKAPVKKVEKKAVKKASKSKGVNPMDKDLASFEAKMQAKRK